MNTSNLITGKELHSIHGISLTEICELIGRGIIKVFDDKNQEIYFYITTCTFEVEKVKDWKTIKKKEIKGSDPINIPVIFEEHKYFKIEIEDSIFNEDIYFKCLFNRESVLKGIKFLKNIHLQEKMGNEENNNKIKKYQEIIDFFLNNAKKIPIDRNTPSWINNLTYEKSPNQLDKNTIRAILHEIYGKYKQPSSHPSEQSYKKLIRTLFENWKKNVSSDDTKELLKTELDKIGVKVSKKILEEIIDKIQ